MEVNQDEENPGHGGCEGLNSMYIKLTSSDEHEFIVKREHAMISSTIKAMLTGPGQFLENQSGKVLPIQIFELKQDQSTNTPAIKQENPTLWKMRSMP